MQRAGGVAIDRDTAAKGFKTDRALSNPIAVIIAVRPLGFAVRSYPRTVALRFRTVREAGFRFTERSARVRHSACSLSR